MTLSIIGQAFVAVRPDLKGFASDLQTKVNALSPVKIKVGITKVSAKAAVDYAFAGMTVSVKLKVKTPSAAEISRQIGTVVLKTTLSPPTGAGRGQALSPAGGETKKAAASGQAAAQKAAAVEAKAAIPATLGLAEATTQAEAASRRYERALRKEARALEELKLRQSKGLPANVASESFKKSSDARLRAEQELGTAKTALNTTRETEALKAAEAERVLALQVELTDKANRESLGPLARRTKLLEEQTVAANALATATARGTVTPGLQGKLDTTTAALRKEEGRIAQQQAAEVKRRAAEEAAQVAAQKAAIRVQSLQTTLPTVGAGITGTAQVNAITRANAELQTAQTEANNLALATTSQLVKDVNLQQNQVTRSVIATSEARAAEIALVTKQLPLEEGLNEIERLRGLTPQIGASRKSAALFLQREAAAANKIAIRLDEQFAGAESVASAAQKDRLRATVAATRATLAEADANLTNVVTLEKTAVAERTAATAAARRAATADTTRSQIKRGTAATGATFLGLRGAVLSASTGFLAATVAVTGLAKIVKTAEDLNRQLNIFQSVSDATASQMAAVDAQARRLGGDLSLPATSATDAAEAMTELQKAGLSVNNTLSASKGVLQLSAAADLSNIDAAKIVATQLNAFQLAGSEAGRIVDLLAGASIAAQGEISDFALAFQQVAAVANQVGLPVETATAVLTQFAKSGIRGSDAGTSLRTMLLRLVPTTKAASDAQAELGINVDRSIPIGEQFTNLVDQYTAALAKLGPVAQQESLTKIFGQDAIRGASVALTSGSDALVSLQAEVSQAGSAARLTEGRVKGLSGSVEGLKSNVSTLSATIGTQMLPLLDSLAHTFSSIATQTNTVAGALTEISNITIKPLGNLLGGTDALAAGGVALAAAIGARKLIRDRVDKAAVAKIDIAVLGLRDRMTELGISEEEVSRLFQVMGITAEEANIRAARAQATLNKELIITKELQDGILKVQAELAIISTPAKTGITAALARQATIQAEIFATQGKVAIGAAESGAIQVEANQKVLASADQVLKTNELIAASSGLRAKAAAGAAAVEVAANRSVIGASLLGRGKGIAGKFGGRGISGKGLGIGIAATIAGEAIGGEAGGVLSAAGTGATFGSFLGPEGAVVGAALFGGFAAIKASKEATKRKQEKLKEEFQKMTPEEQRDLVARMFPDKANKNIQNDILSLLARTKTSNPTRVNPQGKVETARDFVKSMGGLNAEDQKALAALRARNKARRALADEATKGVIPLPSLSDFASPPIPSEGPSPAAEAGIRKAQFAAGGLFGPKFGNIPKKIVIKPPKIEIDRGVITANRKAIAELKAAQTGDTAGLEKIAAAKVADKQSLVNRLNSRLENLKIPEGGPTVENLIAFLKEKSRLIRLSTAAAKDLAKDVNDLNSIQIAAINTESFSVQIGALRAEGTKTLVDDLANARKALAQAEKKPATSPTAKQEKAKAVQAAKNKVGTVEEQIAEKAKSDATQAKTDADKIKTDAAAAAQTRIDTLRRIADNAGNVGKAEDALIAALKQQVVKAKGNAADLNAALSALDAEQKNQAAAIKASQQLNFDLIQSSIDAQASAAALTDSTADDLIPKKRLVALIEREITAAEAFRNAIKNKVSPAWKSAQIEVNKLNDQRNAALGALKDANGGSGFSIEDLFKEALSQFNQFASNVSTSVTTPGGVRGAIGAGIAAQDPRLTKADQLKIAKAAETNDLLQKILDAQNGQSKDGTKARLIDDRDAITPRGAGVGHWTKAQAAAFAKVRSN